MKVWKWTSRELLKAIFCHQKRMTNDRLCMKFSSTPILACISPSILYFKINTPFFCWFLFFKEISTPRSRSAKWQTRIVLITTLVLQHFSENLFPPLAEGGIFSSWIQNLVYIVFRIHFTCFFETFGEYFKKTLIGPSHFISVWAIYSRLSPKMGHSTLDWTQDLVHIVLAIYSRVFSEFFKDYVGL